jgi:hypothetical protein
MMLKRNLVYIISFTVVSCIFFFTSCKDEQVTFNENNQPANAPKLLYPPDRATIQSLFPMFDWEDFTGALSYIIQISTDANFTANVFFDTSVVGSNIQITDSVFATGINYYWHVKACRQSDTTPWSYTYRFWVILYPPEPPVLIAPPNNATGVSFLPFFDWDPVQSAEYYRLQVSRNNSFTQIITDTNRIVNTHYQSPLFIFTTGTQYYWRVNASNSNGYSTGPWSGVFNFTTVSGPEPNSIGGTITFVDTNFIFNEGKYIVNSYINWPPVNSPFTSDTLSISRNGNIYYSDYRIHRLFNGNYYITAAFFTDFSIIKGFILGIYGCDTNHVQYSGCPNNPPSVQITNNAGRDNINFLSWADTSKYIFTY